MSERITDYSDIGAIVRDWHRLRDLIVEASPGKVGGRATRAMVRGWVRADKALAAEAEAIRKDRRK